MKTKPFFFSLESLFVASRNNPGFCKACFRIMADPPHPHPPPHFRQNQAEARGGGDADREKSGRLVAGESAPGGCCLLTHRLVPENRPPSAQQTSWRPFLSA